MKDILLLNGFIDKGFCAVCGGSAKLYNKVVNGRIVEIKVYIKTTPSGQTERGDAMMTMNGSKTKIVSAQYLQSILTHNHLAEIHS